MGKIFACSSLILFYFIKYLIVVIFHLACLSCLVLSCLVLSCFLLVCVCVCVC